MSERIVAIACARNEADIVEVFVRHTLGFADRVVIVDHGSTDSTPAILELLQKEGLPVEVRKLGCIAQMQAETLTAVVRDVVASGPAEWIVPLDVDEFLVPAAGDVRSAILAMPTDHASTARMKTYVPDPGGDANILNHVRRRVAFEAFPFLKVVAIPRALCGDRGQLTPGNHGYLWDGMPIIQWNESLFTAHLPFRTPLQLQAKALGWINHLTRENALANEAVHWKQLFGDFVSGKLKSWDKTIEWALHYARFISPDCPLDLVEDPLPPVKLKYPKLAVRIDPRLILEGMARGFQVPFDASVTTPNLAKAVEAKALAMKGQKPC